MRMVYSAASLRLKWMAAKMQAKIHRRKVNLIQNRQFSEKPVPLALRISAIILDAITRPHVDTTETWKLKSVSEDLTRLSNGAKASVFLSQNHEDLVGEIKKSLRYSTTATKMTSYLALKLHSIFDSFLRQSLHGHSFMSQNHQAEVDAIALNFSHHANTTTTLTQFQRKGNAAYDFVPVRYLSRKAEPRTVRIMTDGSFRWKPEKEAGAGGWIKDVISNTFVEGFQFKCTETYRHPNSGLFEFVAAERGYERVLTHRYYKYVEFVSDSEIFIRDFGKCLKTGKYPQMPRLTDPNNHKKVTAYKEAVERYRSLSRLLKKIRPGTFIKLEKINREDNRLPDVLAKMGLLSKDKDKIYYSNVQEIKEEYEITKLIDEEKAAIEGTKPILPSIEDGEWGGLTQTPLTNSGGFLVWKPKK